MKLSEFTEQHALLRAGRISRIEEPPGATVVNLRRRERRPYDHETEADIPVALSALAWSLAAVQLRKSDVQAVVDVGDEIARQVRARQVRARQVATTEGATS